MRVRVRADAEAAERRDPQQEQVTPAPGRVNVAAREPAMR